MSEGAGLAVVTGAAAGIGRETARALSPPSLRWDSHAREAFAVSCPDLETLR